MTETALDAFIAKKAEVDALLAKLQAASSNHFDVDPENIHWGHVGDLNRLAQLLKEAAREAK